MKNETSSFRRRQTIGERCSSALQKNNEEHKRTLLTLNTNDVKTMTVGVADLAAMFLPPEEKHDVEFPSNLTPSSQETLRDALVEKIESRDPVDEIIHNMKLQFPDAEEVQVVPVVKSKAVKRREQKKKREERRKYEAELEEKMEASSSDRMAPDVVNSLMRRGEIVLQALASRSNTNWHMWILEEEMVLEPMTLFNLLKMFTEKMTMPGCSIQVRAAFMRTLSNWHSMYLEIVKNLDPYSAFYRANLVFMTVPVCVSLKMAKDLEIASCGGLKKTSESLTPWMFPLHDMVDLEDFVSLVVWYPLETMNAMKELIEREEEHRDLEEHVSAVEYKEYRKLAEIYVSNVRMMQTNTRIFDICTHNRWNLFTMPMRDEVFRKLAEVYHTFVTILTRGKVRYLRSAESKSPFKMGNMPDVYQLRWLLDENPMTVYRTFDDVVRRRLVDHDYSNEHIRKEAEKCEELRRACLKWTDEEMAEWAEFGEEHQAAIREFVVAVYWFLKENYSEFVPSDVRDDKAKLGEELKDMVETENQKTETPSEEASRFEKQSDASLQTPESEKVKRASGKSEDVKNIASCDNEKCMRIKSLYLQEQNNRTNAEGELKKNKAKMDEWELLKKEEEKWRQEKKRMAKRIKELEERNSSMTNQADENKRLRERVEEQERQIQKLTAKNRKIEETHEELKTDLTKASDQRNLFRDCLEKINASMAIILKESQRCPPTSKSLNPSVEERIDWHKRLKKELEEKGVANRVRTMTEVLHKKTPEFVVWMESEQLRLEEETRLYSGILDYNLRILEENNSSIGLLPVPLVPGVSARFSAKFHEEFEKLIESNEKSCPVCLETILEGDRIYVCARWKGHVVCFKCGEEWKSTKSSRMMCTLRCPVEMVLGTWTRSEQ